MSSWEAGYCDLPKYTRGQKFLVKPGRLAVEGVYGFMCKARPGLDWEACGFIVRLADKESPKKDDEPYLVTLAFEENPDLPEKLKTYTFDAEGFVHWLAGPFEEAYLRHFPDGTEDRFNSAGAAAKSPMAVREVVALCP